MARSATAPARVGRVPEVARRSGGAAECAQRLGHGGAAALRDGRRPAVRQGRRDHGAVEAQAHALGGGDGRARVAPHPRPGEDRARRLLVQEHGHARRARRVREVGDGGADRRVRRLLAFVGLAAVLAGAFLYVDETSPPWYERLRYPLRYSEYVRVHARQHDLDPALLAAVIYQESKFKADAKSSSGALGLMQLTPATARGIALRTGGHAFRTSDLYNPEINVRYGAWYL